jgi:O-antigen/teichoic acid export membrane protein
MYLVVIKLIEVLARAVFTVGITFALPLTSAGQFGILVTLIGLFAFGFGWERHIDIQRRMVGQSDQKFDQAVTDAILMYLFNYIVMLPVFGLLVIGWVDFSAELVILASLIVISEQISNQLYNITLVQSRYYRPVTIVAIKNLMIVAATAIIILLVPQYLSLQWLIRIWAGFSVLGTLLIALLWMNIRVRDTNSRTTPLLERIFKQHRASLTHFLIGLLGILMLQFDRLAVGGMLPLEQVGVYFRNILLVSFAYQFFNIASYNRALPKIFHRAKQETISKIMPTIYGEIGKVVLLVLILLAAIVGTDYLLNGFLAERFKINVALMALLLFGALLRIAADFHGMLLNARMREKTLLNRQIIAFSFGAASLLSMTYLFGMFGTAIASILTSSLYLVLNRVAVGAIPQEP